MRHLSIVMYHYVRPISKSAYPKIKGLEIEDFKRQLDFLDSNFNFVTAEQIVDSVLNRVPLPKRACWLTFDDGYKDHFLYVLPELLKRGIQGSFFPPVLPVTRRTMLDVNKIHFILEKCANVHDVISKLHEQCIEYEISTADIQLYWDSFAVASRFDNKEIMYIKNMLQFGLPETIRSQITSYLFERVVGISETDFAENLYMSADEVTKLVNSGMYVGSHGYGHLWMNKVDKDSQRFEIEESVKFLQSVGSPILNWIMCYPYGAYNMDTLSLLEGSKCSIGITTKPTRADLDVDHRLELPRFDTNDFPK